ncbi:septum site-determining protein MinC [Noviherbaspirillum massiliense]|uniref:septum site-determining protein MinC n=1 Tax=Noviherbaspirillum massiliense TaxID=1465823 RepID=UPI0003006EEC|nr:septum site-determining protein MinC [Noviherbaspirillum massiliense]
MPRHSSSKPIEIKISTVVAVAVILRESDSALLDAAMKQITGGVPDYFENEFAVIDVGALDAQAPALDWAVILELLRTYRLNPVAVRNASPEMEPDILARGLSLDTVAAPRHEPPREETPAPARIEAAPAQLAAAANALIIDTPVRAGQRIYARGGDLVVTAIVNSGAELIADGSIHVYAPLRGRALAGASGNAGARIFTMSMEAELVSIAGIYRTFDNALPAGVAKKPAQVRLAGDRIDVLSIDN